MSREGEAAQELAVLLRATVDRLTAAGARDEALGAVKEPRGFGPFKSSPAIAPIGRAWRLGSLLLGADASLFSVGRITRATDTGRPQGLSLGVEQRRAERIAAMRGHFADGEVVNFDYEPVDTGAAALADGRGTLLLGADGTVRLRWNSAGDTRALAAYLDEQVALLLDGVWPADD